MIRMAGRKRTARQMLVQCHSSSDWRLRVRAGEGSEREIRLTEREIFMLRAIFSQAEDRANDPVSPRADFGPHKAKNQQGGAS